jgi:hypothetical protein
MSSASPASACSRELIVAGNCDGITRASNQVSSAAKNLSGLPNSPHHGLGSARISSSVGQLAPLSGVIPALWHVSRVGSGESVWELAST